MFAHKYKYIRGAKHDEIENSDFAVDYLKGSKEYTVQTGYDHHYPVQSYFFIF